MCDRVTFKDPFMLIYCPYNEDFDRFKFIANQSYILPVDLDKVNLDNDNSFDENDPDITVRVKLLAWRSRFKKRKLLKKKKISEESIPVTWPPKRWWNFCMSKDNKKEI